MKIFGIIEYWIYSILITLLYLKNCYLDITDVRILIVSILFTFMAYKWPRKKIWLIMSFGLFLIIVNYLLKIGRLILEMIKIKKQFPNELMEVISFYQESNHSPYYYLGLNYLSTANEIRARYYVLSTYFHPDKSDQSWSLLLSRLINQSNMLLNQTVTQKLLGLLDQCFGSNSVNIHQTLERFFTIWPSCHSKDNGDKPFLIKYSLAYNKIFSLFIPKMIKFCPNF